MLRSRGSLSRRGAAAAGRDAGSSSASSGRSRAPVPVSGRAGGFSMSLLVVGACSGARRQTARAQLVYPRAAVLVDDALRDQVVVGTLGEQALRGAPAD